MKKAFKSKRWIAFFLALLLIVTTCITSSDAFLWATGEDETTASVEADNRFTEKVVEINIKDEEETGSADEMNQGEETDPTDEINLEEEADPTDEANLGEETDSADETNQGDETNPEEVTEEAEESVTEEVADGEGQQNPEENAEQETDESAEQAPVDGEVPEEEVIEENPEIPVETATYGYAVYYYYDGVEDESARVEKEGKFGDAIFTSDAEKEVVHNEKNYVLNLVENKDGKIGEDAGQNVVRVYYVLAEEVVEKPAQTLTAAASDGAKVTVVAPEGALPKGAKVTAKVVAITLEMQEAVNDAAGEKTVKILKAYDVKLYSSCECTE